MSELIAFLRASRDHLPNDVLQKLGNITGAHFEHFVNDVSQSKNVRARIVSLGSHTKAQDPVVKQGSGGGEKVLFCPIIVLN